MVQFLGERSGGQIFVYNFPYFCFSSIFGKQLQSVMLLNLWMRQRQLNSVKGALCIAVRYSRKQEISGAFSMTNETLRLTQSVKGCGCAAKLAPGALDKALCGLDLPVDSN